MDGMMEELEGLGGRRVVRWILGVLRSLGCGGGVRDGMRWSSTRGTSGLCDSLPKARGDTRTSRLHVRSVRMVQA